MTILALNWKGRPMPLTPQPSIYACRYFLERISRARRRATAMDLRRSIPTVVQIDDGKSYDTDILDVLIPDAGAFYVMDRGFFDLRRLHRLAQAAAFFVIRFRRIYSHTVSKQSGVMAG